jgi:hypothetical protein
MVDSISRDNRNRGRRENAINSRDASNNRANSNSLEKFFTFFLRLNIGGKRNAYLGPDIFSN